MFPIRKSLYLATPFVVAATAFGLSTVGANTKTGLVLHEWGTFTAVQGSDGVPLSGMHHEEEKLPTFVHGRDPLAEAPPVDNTPEPEPPFHTPKPPLNPPPPSFPPRPPGCGFKCFEDFALLDTKPQMEVTQKMETPVIYLYGPDKQNVSIGVDFPRGIISQYYPAPAYFRPAIGAAQSLSGGHVRFDVQISKEPLALPEVSPRSVYAPSRQVESDYLKSAGEAERFIFYRGLGRFETALKVSSNKGDVILYNQGQEDIPQAFLMYSDGKAGAIKDLSGIPRVSFGNPIHVESSEIAALKSNLVPFDDFSRGAMRFLVKALLNTGLYKDEAVAMAETWKESYFRTPGLRVLYVLSSAETERLLPLTAYPAPTEKVRTLVGRVEVFTDQEERDTLMDVVTQRDSFNAPLKLGRFAEPKLRRILALAKVEEDRAVIRRLIDRLPKD